MRVPRAEVIHGDCLEVMRGMAAGSADAIVTDPPYGSTRTTIGSTGRRFRDGAWSSDFGDWDVFSAEWLEPAARLVRDGGAVVAFCPDWGIGTIRGIADGFGLRWRQTWYWHKTNPPMTFRGLRQFAIESMAYLTKGAHRCTIDNAGEAHNVFHYPFETAAVERVHPTQKPVVLMRDLLRLVTPPGGLILDPFAGSGPTLVAAAIEGFDSIGIEREIHYVEIARRRAAAACQPRLDIASLEATADGR